MKQMDDVPDDDISHSTPSSGKLDTSCPRSTFCLTSKEKSNIVKIPAGPSFSESAMMTTMKCETLSPFPAERMHAPEAAGGDRMAIPGCSFDRQSLNPGLKLGKEGKRIEILFPLLTRQSPDAWLTVVCL
jgi:hypothetical protein